MSADNRVDGPPTPRDNADTGDGTPDRQVNRPDKANNPNGQRDRSGAGSNDSRRGCDDDPDRQEQDPTRG